METAQAGALATCALGLASKRRYRSRRTLVQRPVRKQRRARVVFPGTGAERRRVIGNDRLTRSRQAWAIAFPQGAPRAPDRMRQTAKSTQPAAGRNQLRAALPGRRLEVSAVGAQIQRQHVGQSAHVPKASMTKSAARGAARHQRQGQCGVHHAAGNPSPDKAGQQPPPAESAAAARVRPRACSARQILDRRSVSSGRSHAPEPSSDRPMPPRIRPAQAPAARSAAAARRRQTAKRRCCR
jgi:hypothetical protein